MIIKLEGTGYEAEKQLHKLEQKFQSSGPKMRVLHSRLGPSYSAPTFKVGLRRVIPITESTGSRISISLWPSPTPPVGQSSLLPYTVFSPSPSSSGSSPSTSDIPGIEHVSNVLTFTPSVSPDEYAIFSERTAQSSEPGEPIQEEKTSEVQEDKEQVEKTKEGPSGKLLLGLGLVVLYFMIGE